MAIQKFEDIFACQKAQNLAVDVYSTFRDLKDYGFRDQICRAAVSISNNIAEGFDRSSNADFSRFLCIAIASCSEVRSMVYLASRLDYISDEKKRKLLSQPQEISTIIRDLINSINKS